MISFFYTNKFTQSTWHRTLNHLSIHGSSRKARDTARPKSRENEILVASRKQSNSMSRDDFVHLHLLGATRRWIHSPTIGQDWDIRVDFFLLIFTKLPGLRLSTR